MRYNEELFSPEVQNTISIASLIAQENQHAYILPAHILLGLLHKDSNIKESLFLNDIDVFYLEEWATVKMEDYKKQTGTLENPPIDESVQQIIEEAVNIANNVNSEINLLHPLHVLASLATPGIGFSYDELKTFSVTADRILALFNHKENPQSNWSHKPIAKQPDYLIDLLSQNKNNIKVIERDQEILNISEIIGRQNKPHVVITGERGTGKTVLIQGVLNLFKQKKTSSILQNSLFFELDTNNLLSGISHKGELEERLRKVFCYLEKLNRPILFIDEIQILLDDQSNGKSIYFLLKNQLTKSNTILICTTSNEAFQKLLEKDNPLQNFFEKFNLEEPDQERTSLMININKGYLEEHHNVLIDNETIREAVKLAKRYLPEIQIPESAIKLIDSTMSSIRTQLDTIPIELEQHQEHMKDSNYNKDILLADLKRLLRYTGLETEEELDNSQINSLIFKLQTYIEQRDNKVSYTDLAGSIGRIRNIPVGKIVTKERERLLQMENVLRKGVIGQDIAVQTICEAILESRSGLNKPGLPIGSFFFLGPTGTGKTELAKQLAQYLFQSKDSLIRFDMSEFKEEHSAALLYGAPPGYVGYEEGGMLVNKIRQKPYSVVLFDEIEKAHPSVFDIFLQILDEGKLHDRLGKTGDFSNAVILFTSNIGSETIEKQFNDNQTLPNQTKLMESMALHFRPEFLGRLTGLVPFSPITEEMIGKIFDIQITELEELLLHQGISLEITDEAKIFLAKEGFNPQYGARPLRGVIRSRLRTPFSRMIISEELKNNDQVKISLNDNNTIKLDLNKEYKKENEEVIA